MEKRAFHFANVDYRTPGRAVLSPENRLIDSSNPKPPLDLSEWFGLDRLLAWVEEEVQGVLPPALAGSGPSPAYRQTESLLRLLTLAYATRAFETEEIMDLACTDFTFREICQDQAPTAQRIRTFRRTHRDSLELILSRVLLRAVSNWFDLDPRQYPDLAPDMIQRARDRINIARHMDQP